MFAFLIQFHTNIREEQPHEKHPGYPQGNPENFQTAQPDAKSNDKAIDQDSLWDWRFGEKTDDPIHNNPEPVSLINTGM